VNTDAIRTVVRDALMIGVSIFGIVHQEITGHVSPPLLAVYTTLLGTPAGIGLFKLLRGSPETPPTPESPLPSPPPPPQVHSP
jgi:hypothetical protein